MKPTRHLTPVALLLGALCLALAATSGATEIAKQKPNISGTWERTPDDWFGEDPDDPVLPGGPMPLKEPYASQYSCLLYTSPSPRDVEESRMPSSA